MKVHVFYDENTKQEYLLIDGKLAGHGHADIGHGRLSTWTWFHALQRAGAECSGVVVIPEGKTYQDVYGEGL